MILPASTLSTALSTALGVLLSGGSIIDLDATLFVQLGIFILVYLVLKNVVFRPFMELFAARTKATKGAREEAKELEAEAEEKVEAFEKEMRLARVEAGKERDRLKEDGAKLERELIEKVRRETDRMVREAGKKMSAEADKARSQIQASAPALGRQIAEKLLGREVG